MRAQAISANVASGHTGTNYRLRVLLVEDDQHGLRGLASLFWDEGYRVEAARDGWGALRRIKEGGFDLVVIDLDARPVYGAALSGWELARMYRALHPVTPVVVASIEDGPEVRSRTWPLKAAVLLPKPVDPSRLRAVVKWLGLAAEV